MTINATDILGNGELVIPEGVNARTPEEKQLYHAAMEFERFFVSHMLKQMNAATEALKGDDGDEGGVGGSTGAYKDMAQDQMTQAVLDGGGLGLAATLYGQLGGGA